MLLPTYTDCSIGSEELRMEDTPDLCEKEKKYITRKPVFPAENISPTSAEPGELADAF